MSWEGIGVLISFASLVITALVLVLSQRKAAIAAAEDRGAMSQRMRGVEDDLAHHHADIAANKIALAALSVTLAKLETGQEQITAAVKELSVDMKKHLQQREGSARED